MQLLILVEGMGQLVHSLMGRKEGQLRAEDWLPARAPVLPGMASGLILLPNGLPLFLHFTHKEPRGVSCQ